ncbi:hypothetical protein L484_026482 [Morus notabilis]|uniref:Root meristem growth factor 8 n=1 Tax=Morus notabilis TaxID=981085 RepID=W9QWD2_9ROSA|nr:hypothetical protein L484_026482 [Morus notabilis]
MVRLMAVLITVICILFSALFTPCSSLHIPLLQSSSKHAKNELVQPSDVPTFSRKLRINEEVSVVGRAISDSKSNKKKDVLGDKHQNKEQKVVAVVHGSKGTWQEWSTAEGTGDESNFFTMDYSRVRRRRPIHNKSVPVRDRTP